MKGVPPAAKAGRAARQIRAIDLFCGAGGSSWGAKQAGIKVIAAFDSWPLAGETHTANFPDAEFIEVRLEDHDLARLVDRLGPIDLIIASPECTSHSPARGNKPKCERSKDTAFEVVRYAEAFKPRWIVIENVVSMRRWSRYKEFLSAIRALGFNLREQILNAAKFGVGQSRRRLFLICDRLRKPAATPTLTLNPPVVSSFVNFDSPYKWTPLRKRGRAKATLARADRGIKSLGSNKPFLLVYYGSDGAGGWQKIDRTLRTVTTVDRFAIICPSGDGERMRMLQVPELQTAMGMKGMRFDRGSRREKIKMLGNAVCPPVMRRVLQYLTAE